MLARAVAVATLIAATAPAKSGGIAGQFDFYVLSMAWSAQACAADEDYFDEILCRPGGNGFSFTGLAPRQQSGAVTSCATLLPTALSSRALVDLADFMPKSAAADEWRVRGVCTGLSADAYFHLARQAVATVAVPPDLTRPGVADKLTPQQISDDFASVNPGMTADGLAVDCRQGLFTGLRICLTKELAFRPCEEVHATSCQGDSLAIPEIE